MREPLRILLVEDNPADVDLARESLEAERFGIEVTAAPDGTAALALLDASGGPGQPPLPHLILLDLSLPNMHGRQVLRWLKDDLRLRLIPVVILSSSDASSDVVGSYELGANCYVTKPVDFKSYRDAIAVLRDFWTRYVKLPAAGEAG
jgi:two-component system, chemotaxis family, response regulator Rcp1